MGSRMMSRSFKSSVFWYVGVRTVRNKGNQDAHILIESHCMNKLMRVHLRLAIPTVESEVGGREGTRSRT